MGEITTTTSPTLEIRCGEKIAAPVKQEIDLVIRDADLPGKGDCHSLDIADRLVEQLDRSNPSLCAGYRAMIGAASTWLARCWASLAWLVLAGHSASLRPDVDCSS